MRRDDSWLTSSAPHRPRCPQTPADPTHFRRCGVWFTDEARVGQKNKITQRWAKRGTRPPRKTSVPPPPKSLARSARRRQGAGLVLPLCNTQAMNLHLAEISAMVAPGRHALLLLDQAGWHLLHHLVVPENVTLLPLTPKCPNFNPVENIWQLVRDNWLSNRIFTLHHDIVEHYCKAWNRLTDCPSRITSIGMRVWIDGL